MKRALSIILLTLGLVFLLFGCDRSNTIDVTIDIASSSNFRCDVYLSASNESYTLTEKDSVHLFQKCFENKENGTKLKGDAVGVGENFIKLQFIGDAVDNAPVKDGKADYSTFTVFSNNTVRFEYDNASEYYQFETGFYNFVQTYLLIFAEK